MSNVAHSQSLVFFVSSNRTCVCEVGRFGEVIRCDEIVTLRGRLRRPPSYRPPDTRRLVDDAEPSLSLGASSQIARLELARERRRAGSIKASTDTTSPEFVKRLSKCKPLGGRVPSVSSTRGERSRPGARPDARPGARPDACPDARPTRRRAGTEIRDIKRIDLKRI
ncbi:unnamed protein product [Euphydryas editha]|uniref:Uncharacterized protein n=1 Tax=Euphydryas editha TaxID=104508 RepID=A0AAU9TJP7_EUPED|nr:unnamed protein product [Euphydryas editha]